MLRVSDGRQAFASNGLRRRKQRLDLGRVAPLDQLGLDLERLVIVQPPIGAARGGERERRAAQLCFQEAERLHPPRLAEFLPLDPILRVDVAPLGPLPEAVIRKAPIP